MRLGKEQVSVRKGALYFRGGERVPKLDGFREEQKCDNR